MPGCQLGASGEVLPESLTAMARCGEEELEATGNMWPVDAALLAAGALGASELEG
jgi:hypothetical protein